MKTKTSSIKSNVSISSAIIKPIDVDDVSNNNNSNSNNNSSSNNNNNNNNSDRRDCGSDDGCFDDDSSITIDDLRRLVVDNIDIKVHHTRRWLLTLLQFNAQAMREVRSRLPSSDAETRALHEEMSLMTLLEVLRNVGQDTEALLVELSLNCIPHELLDMDSNVFLNGHDCRSRAERERDVSLLTREELVTLLHAHGIYTDVTQHEQEHRSKGDICTKVLSHLIGHCSWCLRVTVHIRTQYNVVRRSVYTCLSCMNRSLLCRGSLLYRCSNMSRGHAGYDDESCLQCAGLLYNCSFVNRKASFDSIEAAWRTGVTAERGRCDWCSVKNARHILEKSGRPIIGLRAIYRCLECRHRTLRCRHCNNFSRGHPTFDDDRCSVCLDLKITLLLNKYCSWCVKQTSHHLLQNNYAKRSVFSCKACVGHTVRCRRCDFGMACSLSGLGMDHVYCTACSYKINWSTLSEYIISRQYYEICQSKVCDIESYKRLRALLCIGTKEKVLALRAGMIRPFLALVTMSVCERARVANSLGLNLIVESYKKEPARLAQLQAERKMMVKNLPVDYEWSDIMDAHACGTDIFFRNNFADYLAHIESWRIINANSSGIIARSNEFYSLNNANWDETLRGVCMTIFNSACKKLQLPHDKSLWHCVNPLDSRIREIEAELLDKMCLIDVWLEAAKSAVTKQELSKETDRLDNSRTFSSRSASMDSRNKIEAIRSNVRAILDDDGVDGKKSSLAHFVETFSTVSTGSFIEQSATLDIESSVTKKRNDDNKKGDDNDDDGRVFWEWYELNDNTLTRDEIVPMQDEPDISRARNEDTFTESCIISDECQKTTATTASKKVLAVASIAMAHQVIRIGASIIAEEVADVGAATAVSIVTQSLSVASVVLAIVGAVILIWDVLTLVFGSSFASLFPAVLLIVCSSMQLETLIQLYGEGDTLSSYIIDATQRTSEEPSGYLAKSVRQSFVTFQSTLRGNSYYTSIDKQLQDGSIKGSLSADEMYYQTTNSNDTSLAQSNAKITDWLTQPLPQLASLESLDEQIALSIEIS